MQTSKANKDHKVVYIRETNFQSYVADAMTFGVISASFWFNYKFIGGNDALDVLLFLCFFIFVIARAQDTNRRADEASKQ